MVKYFFDSYAVIEVVKGNPLYAKYANEVVIITLFNLVEIYWSFVNEYGEEKANHLYKNFKECVIPINDIVIQEAVKLRKKNKKRNLSYADCIGYVYACQNNLLFLTGDKEFENMSNVEFARKN